jgi:hypothetical protein
VQMRVFVSIAKANPVGAIANAAVADEPRGLLRPPCPRRTIGASTPAQQGQDPDAAGQQELFYCPQQGGDRADGDSDDHGSED